MSIMNGKHIIGVVIQTEMIILYCNQFQVLADLCLIVIMTWDAGRGLTRATYCAFTVGTNNGSLVSLHNSVTTLGTLLTLLGITFNY